MLSLLKQRFASESDLLQRQFPGFWLIWEPGRWHISGVFETTLDVSKEQPKLKVADSLCFYLRSDTPLKLGRSPDCDMVINDATVSREHLVLEPVGATWQLKVLSSQSTTFVDTRALNQNDSRLLQSGQLIQIGDARLTYVDTEGLGARLAQFP